MKTQFLKQSILMLSFLFSVGFAFSQAPEKLSYQSVIRRTNNDLVVNQNVRVKISILQGSTTGTAFYVEDHTTSTNSNGLVSLSIGGGNVISGSFSAINWENGPYFVKMEADPTGGTNYTVSGTSQLLSVPYALYAKTSGSAQDTWNSTGNTGTNPTTNFIGTTDAKDWVVKTNNTERLRINSGGSVGIGTSSPQEMLHVKSGNIKVESTNADRHVLISENGGLELFRSAATTSPETNGFIDFKDTLSDDFDHRIFFSNKNFLPPSGGLIFASGPIRKDRLVILNNGNIGIGVSNPTGKFQVKNDVSGSDSSFIVTTAGKIGIGTTSPTAKLDVSGTVKIADGTQGAGKVLTSDASGNASWQSSSAGRTVRGTSSAGGSPTVINGSGFTATRSSAGAYAITFATPFTTTPTVTASVYNTNATYLYEVQIVKISGVTVNGFTIYTFGGSNFQLVDWVPFSFIAIGN